MLVLHSFAIIQSLPYLVTLKTKQHVKVFERSQFKNEVGAAITITPNATRVLNHWGFNYKIAGAVENHQVCVGQRRARIGKYPIGEVRSSSLLGVFSPFSSYECKWPIVYN
jgi:hypothetical protein